MKSARTLDPPRKSEELFPLSFHWGDRDVGRMGWDEVTDGSMRMWRDVGVVSQKNINSLLYEKENMANSSSHAVHAAPHMTSAQAHRADILENPLQVSLFKFWLFGQVKEESWVEHK